MSSINRFSRKRKLDMLPQWWRDRIEVNWRESLRLLEQAQEQIPAGALLLDAGSGEGRYKEMFAHTNYVGLDLAVGDVTWDYTGLDTVGNLRKLPFADESFDAAICVQTMEHVDNPFEVTQEIGRVLRPGGRYYLSAPMMWYQHQKPHDYYRYTSFGLEHLLKENDMRIVKIRPMGGYFWFLSFYLQMLHVLLFPRAQSNLQRLLQLPFQAVVQGVFFYTLPLLFYYLDHIDKIKDHTLGWVLIAEKLGDSSSS